MAVVYIAVADGTPIRVIVLGAAGPCGAFSAFKLKGKWHNGPSPLTGRDIERLYKDVSGDPFLNTCSVAAALYALWPEEAEAHRSREAILEADREQNPTCGTW